jgi:adenylate kinase family enzyme
VVSNDDKWRRVSVVGTSCSGKTVFSAALAAALDSPHIQLDTLAWLPEWTARPAADFRALVADRVVADRWVVDGNYSRVRDLVWPRATAVVWLDYPFPLVFSRALRRTVSRVVTGEALHGGNRESFRRSFLSTDSMLHWVIATHGHNRRKFGRLRSSDEWAHLPFAVLRGPGQARELLADVSSTVSVRRQE